MFGTDDCAVEEFVSKALSQEYRELVKQVRKYTADWIQRVDLEASLYARFMRPLRNLAARVADTGEPFRLSLSREETAALADELLDWIESLPCSYDYFFPLPALRSFGKSTLEISPRVALVDVSGSNERYEGFVVVSAQEYAAAPEVERRVYEFGELVESETRLEVEELTDFLRQKLRPVTCALDSPHDTPGLPNLFTAAEWLFDAEAEQNQTISFIQTCIAFEALLGDQREQEERGVTASLADRLAFLLGRGVGERDAIRETFKKY